MTSSALIKKFREQLHDWFEENKRDLPWRHTTDPYMIWVSEVVLQQTTVEQGMAYYKRFVETFPDVYTLAKAPEQDVLKLWQGLGYYSRARHMLKTAKIIVEKYGGRFPETYKEMVQLPGIGPYTASAILSFAFNLPHAVADGNVIRVVARLAGVEEAVNSTQGLKTIQMNVEKFFDTAHPSGYNQAIMEFGALHCKVHKPLCTDCFAKNYCKAFADNTQGIIPVKLPKREPRSRFFTYVVPIFESAGEKYSLLKRRTEKDIWHNMYDFSLIESLEPPEYTAFLKSIAFSNTFKQSFGTDSFEINSISKNYIHKLTHQTIYAVFVRIAIKEPAALQDFIKVSLEKPLTYPLPKLIENYLAEGF